MTNFELIMLDVEPLGTFIDDNAKFEDANQLGDNNSEDEEEQKTIILIFSDSLE